MTSEGEQFVEELLEERTRIKERIRAIEDALIRLSKELKIDILLGFDPKK